MKHIANFLFDLASNAFFIIMVSLLLVEQRYINNLYYQVRDYVTDGSVLYENAKSTTTNFFQLTRQEVISDLLAGISYDIQINGSYYDANGFNPSLFDFTSLKDNYLKSYVKDTKTGKIQYVLYE